MALAAIQPAIASVESPPPAASSASELLAERMPLGIIAALAAAFVPGYGERLIGTPLTWGDLASGLRRRRPRRASPPVTTVW